MQSDPIRDAITRGDHGTVASLLDGVADAASLDIYLLLACQAGRRECARMLLDAHAATIASLTNKIAELTATNKKLVAALAAAKQSGRNTNPPPGFAADANLTGHSLNSLGESCRTKKWRPDSRWQFLNQQFCKTCNNMVKHIPADCPELPGNKKIKEEMVRARAKRRVFRSKKSSAVAAATVEE